MLIFFLRLCFCSQVQGNNIYNNTPLFMQSTTSRTEPDKVENVEKPTKIPIKPINNYTIRPSITSPLSSSERPSNSSSNYPYLDHINNITSTIKPPFSSTKPHFSSSTHNYLGHLSTSSKPSSSSHPTYPHSAGQISTHFPTVPVVTIAPKPVITISTSAESSVPNKKPISTTQRPIIVSRPQTVSVKPDLSKPSTATPGNKPGNTSSKPKPKPTTKPTLSSPKPGAKPPRPSSKPTSKPVVRPSIKPINQSKPVSITKPQKPTVSTLRPTTLVQKPYSPSGPNITKPVSGGKPPSATKPQKPAYVPGYVEVPVTTFIPSLKPSTENSKPALSNDILQPVSTPSSTTFESAEENTNLVSGSTTLPPALVTWTTVDEVPARPPPKPATTPDSPCK